MTKAVLSCAVQQQRTQVSSVQHEFDLSYVPTTCETEDLSLFLMSWKPNLAAGGLLGPDFHSSCLFHPGLRAGEPRRRVSVESSFQRQLLQGHLSSESHLTPFGCFGWLRRFRLCGFCGQRLASALILPEKDLSFSISEQMADSGSADGERLRATGLDSGPEVIRLRVRLVPTKQEIGPRTSGRSCPGPTAC